MPNDIPRVDVISQAVAISGFTDDGKSYGHIDLTDKIPAGSIVLGWKGSITTRFTGGTGDHVSLAVGTPGNSTAFSVQAFREVSNNAGSKIADVPEPESAADAIGSDRTIRVTVMDRVDFGQVSGGAITLSLYYLRTEA